MYRGGSQRLRVQEAFEIVLFVCVRLCVFPGGVFWRDGSFVLSLLPGEYPESVFSVFQKQK